MPEIRYYLTTEGYAPIAEWFAELDPVTRARVTRAIARLEQGNVSNVKSVGEGVLECRIDFGPGYRVYFGRDGNALVNPADGRSKEAPAARYRYGAHLLAGLQAKPARTALNGEQQWRKPRVS